MKTVDENLAQQVRDLKYVREARIVDNKLLVNLENPETQNPEIIRTLVEAGAEVQFVGELRHSLEDVYLQLVKEN